MQITPTQARLSEEKKLRMARIKAAAIRHKQRKEAAENGAKALELYRCVASYDATNLPSKNTSAGRKIMQEVALEHGLTVLDLVSARRQRGLVRVRHLAMWRIKNETKLSLPQIGRLFERDHTSILHAVRKIDALKNQEGADHGA